MSYHCNLCGRSFRSYNAEAFHRHNAPLMCKRSDRLRFKGIIGAKRKLLEQAVLKGGSVFLTGPYRIKRWGKREVRAAQNLLAQGYGTIHNHEVGTQFFISELGREVIR